MSYLQGLRRRQLGDVDLVKDNGWQGFGFNGKVLF
jgi:hypothetical protein